MGNFFLCRALVLLTENLYWTISILNDDFGTKCWELVQMFQGMFRLFVTVGLPVVADPPPYPLTFDPHFLYSRAVIVRVL